MVVFNDLRIADDKKSLIVDCSVEDLSIYSNVYITRIDIDYYKNVDTSGDASDKAITIYEDNGEHAGSVRACLTKKQIEEASGFGTVKFDGGMFYVFVTCSDNIAPAAGTLPCGFDRNTDIGIVPDWEMLYEIGMRYIIDLAGLCMDTCKDNSDFVTFLLLWNSLKLALDTCEFELIERVWDRILRMYRFNGITAVGGCGCSQ